MQELLDRGADPTARASDGENRESNKLGKRPIDVCTAPKKGGTKKDRMLRSMLEVDDDTAEDGAAGGGDVEPVFTEVPDMYTNVFGTGACCPPSHERA